MTTLLAEQEEQTPEETIEGGTQTAKLRPSVIRRDGGTQMRAELNPEVVDEYREKMEAGVIFDPPVVFEDEKGNYWLGDGFYRTAAFEKAEGLGWGILCEVRQGSQRDAVLYATGANADHGQPRSWEDKRRAVMTLLDDTEWSQWSNGIIAEKARVSAPFVGKLREKASQNVSSEGEQQPAVRRGKDNVVRDTTNIGRKSDEEIETAARIDLEKNPPLPGVDPALIQPLEPGEPSQEGAQSGDPETEQIKVTDKRRFADSGSVGSTSTGSKAPDPKTKSIAEVLKGRMLTISFTWIPNVPGVSVSVRAGKPENAERKVIGSAEVPPMPEVVQEMITGQLKGTKPAVSSKAPARTATKKAASKRSAKPPAQKKSARKPTPRKTARRAAKGKKKR